jgi:extracellular elastinolytic metalloproteinase
MSRSHLNRLLVLGTAISAVAALSAMPPAGAAQNQSGNERHAGPASSSASRDSFGFYDSRTNGGRTTQAFLRSRTATLPSGQATAIKRLARSLGPRGVVAIDPLTRTPSQVSRLDGFLTGASRASASRIALRYVRSNRTAFGLTASGLRGLHLRSVARDFTGMRTLSFQQLRHGVPVFGSGLRVNVAKNGRIINVLGPPVTSLTGAAAAPRLTAAAARSLALRNVKATVRSAKASRPSGAARTTTFRGGDRASLVWFPTVNGLKLGWQTIVNARKAEMYSSVVDATSGTLLFRRNLGNTANGFVWENYPGAPQGGRQQNVNFTTPGWLANNAPTLSGPNAHVYTDINDNDAADPGEDVAPNSGRNFRYPFTAFPSQSTPCTRPFPCSWAPNTANSWRTNQFQNATQVFFFVNNFHDHLEAAPIGFTPGLGNFENIDPVQAEPLDGANTAAGLPDGNHIDNANMNTPPDGIPPRMQMFLFHQPGTTYPDGDPFIASNGGDEADVVYHEYTHGLSNRLVVDGNGDSTLGPIQAGAMGEAWRDWYAMDYLVSQGLFRDTAADGDLRVGQYVGAGLDLIRSQPMDCPVGSTSPLCHGTTAAGSGGYTYGDYGKIAGGPEVHGDGEIWGETLWDLRRALGQNLTELLVTRAMLLSPSNPSMLDERDAILQADEVFRNGRQVDAIWSVFARRGMGFFAGALDGNDSEPGEDFHTPPAVITANGTLTGTVTDADSGAPVAGVTVTVARQGGGLVKNPSAITNAAGQYRIAGLVPGTYPKVVALGAGFDPVRVAVTVNAGDNVQNFQVRRDWMAASGGATVGPFDGPDFTPFGCGPINAIDQNQAAGWGSTSDLVLDATNHQRVGPDTPKSLVVNLPRAVNLTEFQLNPSAICGDGASASTADWTFEVSTDGLNFTQVASGHYSLAERGKMNVIPLATPATGVTAVRFTMASPQVFDPAVGGPDACPGAFSGCDFMDMTEVAAYGAPTP